MSVNESSHFMLRPHFKVTFDKRDIEHRAKAHIQACMYR